MYAYNNYCITFCIPGDTSKRESRGCRSNEDLLVAYNGMNQETAATTSEFSQALLIDCKGAGEDAAFVNNVGTEHDTKQTEETLDSKPIESDEVKDIGVLGNSSLLSPVKPNMDVDCFVPSPGSLLNGNCHDVVHVN